MEVLRVDASSSIINSDLQSSSDRSESVASALSQVGSMASVGAHRIEPP